MIAAGATLYRLQWTDERRRRVPKAVPVEVLSAPLPGPRFRFDVRDEARSWTHYAYTLPDDDQARAHGAVAVTPPGSYLFPSAALVLDDARVKLRARLDGIMRDAALVRRQVEALDLALADLIHLAGGTSR